MHQGGSGTGAGAESWEPAWKCFGVWLVSARCEPPGFQPCGQTIPGPASGRLGSKTDSWAAKHLAACEGHVSSALLDLPVRTSRQPGSGRLGIHYPCEVELHCLGGAERPGIFQQQQNSASGFPQAFALFCFFCFAMHKPSETVQSLPFKVTQ